MTTIEATPETNATPEPYVTKQVEKLRKTLRYIGRMAQNLPTSDEESADSLCRAICDAQNELLTLELLLAPGCGDDEEGVPFEL